MRSTSDTRVRIIKASTQLFRRQGYEGTGLKQIVDKSGAAWGSLYHFFPGGKEQLGIEVITHHGESYRSLIERTFEEASDSTQAVINLFASNAEELVNSHFTDGCPIMAIALDSMDASANLRQACANVIEIWVRTVASQLVSDGIDDTHALDVAISIIGALEGAIALSRIIHLTEPLASASRVSVMAVRSALDDARGTKSVAPKQSNRPTLRAT